MKILNLRILLALLTFGYAIVGVCVFTISLIAKELRVAIPVLAALGIYWFFVMDTVKLYKESEKK